MEVRDSRGFLAPFITWYSIRFCLVGNGASSQRQLSESAFILVQGKLSQIIGSQNKMTLSCWKPQGSLLYSKQSCFISEKGDMEKKIWKPEIPRKHKLVSCELWCLYILMLEKDNYNLCWLTYGPLFARFALQVWGSWVWLLILTLWFVLVIPVLGKWRK